MSDNTKTGYFESHAHLDDRRFDKDRLSVITGLKENGVDYVINVGASMEGSQNSINLARKYNFIYAAVGVHPHDASSMKPGDIDKLRKWAELPEVVAIGEIGLDFHYDHSPRDVQKKRFAEQLELTEETGLPVIIHCREADQTTFDMIRASSVRRGVIHCYSGSAEMAIEYVKLGFKLGIGGVLTYPNARKLIETVMAVPLTSILTETDCPYLPPVPYRGQRNSPAYLPHIGRKIAELKGVSEQEVIEVTAGNARELFFS